MTQKCINVSVFLHVFDQCQVLFKKFINIQGISYHKNTVFQFGNNQFKFYNSNLFKNSTHAKFISKCETTNFNFGKTLKKSK